MSGGLQFNFNYTWAKAIDDVEARNELGGNAGDNAFANQYDRRADKGLIGQSGEASGDRRPGLGFSGWARPDAEDPESPPECDRRRLVDGSDSGSPLGHALWSDRIERRGCLSDGDHGSLECDGGVSAESGLARERSDAALLHHVHL